MRKLKIIHAVVALVACAVTSQAQTVTKTIQIHFETGKYVLTKEHKKVIRYLFDSIPQEDSTMSVQLKGVTVNGHTDNEGDNAYNMELSEKRADAVISYLTSRGVDAAMVNKNYYGEAKPIAPNDDSYGKLKNRRVDIAVTYTIIKKHDNSSDNLAGSAGPCSHDTTIMLTAGSKVTMSICDYERMGGEFHITEVLNGDAVRKSGLNTMGDDGTPLMSGGMFDIRFKNDSCLKKPITIRVPVDTCIKQPKKMQQYVYNYRNGYWTRTRAKVRVVKVNKVLFYEFKVTCPGKINLDCPRYFAWTDKRKFFAKDGLTLVKLSISNDCPCSMLEAKIAPGGKKAYGWVGTYQAEPYVSAKVLDKNGDTLTMQYKPLNDLLTKGSRQVTRRFLGIIPIRKSIYYDKYCIRRTDFDIPAMATR
ncbi:MAG TPA: OmpA family protein [Bacteroidia bacterium]|jgi:hypothetical protein|nr:OmpA family protein [Bacteroidia bacterium]